jgi:uncharacterized protein with von Willebrand factor type A (vWA) domain
MAERFGKRLSRALARERIAASQPRPRQRAQHEGKRDDGQKQRGKDHQRGLPAELVDQRHRQRRE